MADERLIDFVCCGRQLAKQVPAHRVRAEDGDRIARLKGYAPRDMWECPRCESWAGRDRIPGVRDRMAKRAVERAPCAWHEMADAYCGTCGPTRAVVAKSTRYELEQRRWNCRGCGERIAPAAVDIEGLRLMLKCYGGPEQPAPMSPSADLLKTALEKTGGISPPLQKRANHSGESAAEVLQRALAKSAEVVPAPTLDTERLERLLADLARFSRYSSPVAAIEAMLSRLGCPVLAVDNTH